VSSDRPWLWVVAGVNGAGKTTLVKRFLPDLPFINADEVAQEMSPGEPQRAAIAAGRMVLEQFGVEFERHRDVAWETTLSGRFHRRAIQEARSQGYRIGAIYVGVENARLAISRVSDRVFKGGHDVPEKDIERRYKRSLLNLRDLITIADYAFVFDNSGEAARGHRRIMRVEHQRVTRIAPPVPTWLIEAIGELSVAVGATITP